ncbi:hypothetical protein SO802_013447 [Lithocarpus litseifolius]|uniref:Putative plant transposon protein domain-containing protein n=1 Tax=Lithocarpus litseifolius TaxID=425828 RepID=A0AAW2DB44_9ROSI
MAITSIDSKDDLSNLVNKLGDLSEDEEVEESEDEDVCQNEGENNLQEAYDSLLEDCGKYAKVVNLAVKKMKKVEEEHRSKRTRSPTEAFDLDKFRSYAAFQEYEKYFRDAPLLVERVVDQASLLETKISKWVATKDWNYLLSNLDDAYENMVQEFYANAIIEGEKLKCWVRGKSFSVTPVYLADILRINRPMFTTPPVYDDLNQDEEILRKALGDNLELSSMGNQYMNLGRALFLHDLITDEEIDVCSHIFHILAKTAERTTSRNCIPFCHLFSKILKLKGVHPLEDERPYPRPNPINVCTLNASISHSWKETKQESHAPHASSSSSSHFYDEKLDNIMSPICNINTKLSGLASIMHP